MKLKIRVTARALEPQPEAPAEFVYHASFPESNISHWCSRGETMMATVVSRAREVAAEAGYETEEEVELIEEDGWVGTDA